MEHEEDVHFHVRPMTSQDVPFVRDLVDTIEYLCLESWETDEVLCEAVRMNPGLSQVAVDLESGELIGAVFFGSTGLRAQFQHLAVAPLYRGRGVGHAIVEGAIATLRQCSKVRRVVCAVLASNQTALSFWRSAGFTRTSGIDGMVVFMIRDLESQQNGISNR